ASIFSEAAQALRFNRQRSILTMVSLGWGVACFVILYSYGEGFDITLRTAFQAIGQDLIVMFPGQTSTQAGGERAGHRIRLERDEITINGLRFTVVGVLRTKTQISNYNTPDNECIFVPYDSMGLLRDVRYPNDIVWTPANPIFRADAVKQVRATLARNHNF